MDSKFDFELKNSFEKRKILLQLQNDFELGLISESDLTKNKIQELEKLYDEQINELDRKINKKKKILIDKIKTNNKNYKKAINAIKKYRFKIDMSHIH